MVDVLWSSVVVKCCVYIPNLRKNFLVEPSSTLVLSLPLYHKIVVFTYIKVVFENMLVGSVFAHETITTGYAETSNITMINYVRLLTPIGVLANVTG